MKQSKANNITHVELFGRKFFNADDTQIKERLTNLYLNEDIFFQTVMTPGQEEFWATGHLLCSRVINSIEDIKNISVNDADVKVTVNKRLKAALTPIPVLWNVEAEIISRGIRWLADSPLFLETGGAHVAAIMSLAGEKLFRAEDIGRHNAVDKTIGWAVNNHVDLSLAILALSGRMPSDMVEKAWGANIGLMASISAPSAEGVETAKRANMSIVGFVRGDRMNIYSVPERIILG